jgi:hypothetical protein
MNSDLIFFNQKKSIFIVNIEFSFRNLLSVLKLIVKIEILKEEIIFINNANHDLI